MTTEKLMRLKDQADIKSSKITRLLDDKKALEKAIEDLNYLKLHAGEMIFTGNSGKIGDRDVLLKKVKINTLAGCVAVPDLLLDLAAKRLVEIETESNTMLGK